MNVLISGAGIAGPTLAFWLEKYGFAPTLVESAPASRASGYVIDFWGLGYDMAEKMGLLPDIARIGYHMQELRIVDDCGRRLSGFGVQVFRELTGGRYITLRRSDLSKLIYDQISGSCEIIFGDSITSLREAHGAVRVEFEHGSERCFDLVIGADGLHSHVRKLVFGTPDRYEKDLGYRVAAFETTARRARLHHPRRARTAGGPFHSAQGSHAVPVIRRLERSGGAWCRGAKGNPARGLRA
jgi:2-polyprenyl-6-methoxyphenol hydroxylase-like FAD-dependent oxidoreductase